MSKFKKIIFFLLIAGTINNTYSQNFSKRKINNLKTQISHMVEDDKKMTQVMKKKKQSKKKKKPKQKHHK